MGLKSWQGQAITLVLGPTHCPIGRRIPATVPMAPDVHAVSCTQMGTSASFLGVKWQGYGIDHHTLIVLSYTSTTTTFPPLNAFMACCSVDVPLTSLCIILAYIYIYIYIYIYTVPGESLCVSIGCMSVYLLFLNECTSWTLSTILG